MSDFPYFPFYPTDFLGDDKVVMMSLEEVGAFVKLLCFAWQQDPAGSIPSNPKVIAKILGITEEQWSSIAKGVLQCWYEDGGRYHSKRLGKIFDEMMEKHLSRVKSGSKGGKQRSSNAKALLKQTGGGGGSNNNTPETGEESEGNQNPSIRSVEVEADPAEPTKVVGIVKLALECFHVPVNIEQLKANIYELLSAGWKRDQIESVLRWSVAPNARASEKDIIPVTALFATDPKQFAMWFGKQKTRKSQISEMELKSKEKQLRNGVRR